MPYDDPDPQDPMLLVGVDLPGTPEDQRRMAGVFAEEYARLGFARDPILSLFRNPFYAGAHRALSGLGEAEIERIVDEVLAVWGRVRFVDRDAPERAPMTLRKGGL